MGKREIRPLATRSATTAEKLRRTKVLVPTPGRLRPAPGQRPGCGGCGRESPPPAVGIRRCDPWNFFENLDAKSCILVASALISGLPMTCKSAQTASMSRANQFQNCNFSAVVAPLDFRTKNQSNGNYETCKLHATRHLGP